MLTMVMCLLASSTVVLLPATAFVVTKPSFASSVANKKKQSPFSVKHDNSFITVQKTTTTTRSSSTSTLYASDDDSSSPQQELGDNDQVVLGSIGTLAALIVLYSEFTLKTTGCGLPAGPAGLVGAAEGISYLVVVALCGYSLKSKFQTGAGLPAGPGGLLGAAEGLSFLAIVAGIGVLGFQIMDYGYIPNAVPMEGGMCN